MKSRAPRIALTALTALSGLLCWLATAATAHADDTVPEEQWNAKFQATYVWQGKSAMHAAYSGANSLHAASETSYSFTTTAALGWRPWSGGELYLDPEAAQGKPLSDLTGLGCFTNGEMARSAGTTIKAYRARAIWRQTWGDGGPQDAVQSAANQLAGMVDRRRWVLTVGNQSVQDIFDNNRYSHDPRTQFLNWSLMTHGAYDYAGDARGYTWGLAVERYLDEWVLRAGRYAEPKLPNQQALDAQIFVHHGDQVELEHAHQVGGLDGKLRLLAFRNRMHMSRYQDALDQGEATASTPDLNAVRSADHVKWGLGLNLEQTLGDDVGVFARASWADGATETYAFTEIDRSLSGGVVWQGAAWGRGGDTLGLGWVRNGLSQAHRDYLAVGGMGFFIGDGQLRYRPEQIIEAVYSLALGEHLWASLDVQHIRNPAYNADRGPVRVSAVRLHTEF